LAVVASRSSLVGALLRAASLSRRHPVLDFLEGLSQDELECLADFQGSSLIEAEYSLAFNAYRFMGEFFNPAISERWQNPGDRAHKTFIVLAWLDKLDCPVPVRLHSA
jgi:hypothetical protein